MVVGWHQLIHNIVCDIVNVGMGIYRFVRAERRFASNIHRSVYWEIFTREIFTREIFTREIFTRGSYLRDPKGAF